MAEETVSCVAELLAPFPRHGKLVPSMLVRYGGPLTLASLELEEGRTVVDLDDPTTLLATDLRPSQVATRRRGRDPAAGRGDLRVPSEAVALRWGSTLESSWISWTVFDGVEDALDVAEAAELTVEHPFVLDAAEVLGLRLT